MTKHWTAAELAVKFGGTVQGDGSVHVSSLASLEQAGPADLTFAADAKRLARVAQSKAAAVLVPQAPPDAPMTLIVVPDVHLAVARFLEMLAGPPDVPPPGVHPSAVVAEDAELGEAVAVGPGVVLAPGVRVGEGTVLCAGVVLGRDVHVGNHSTLQEGVVVRWGCRIGHRVQIGPNSVIGADGFGFHFANGVHHKVPHVGAVIIEDDVELGACVCVDRAKFGVTRIGHGSKVDNLVQIAHNVQVGRGCLLAGQVGVAGSAKLGDYVVLGGSAGVRDNVVLGDRVQAAAFTAIATDIPADQVVAGIPAREASETKRVVMSTYRLPELLKQIKQLEARLKSLEDGGTAKP